MFQRCRCTGMTPVEAGFLAVAPQVGLAATCRRRCALVAEQTEHLTGGGRGGGQHRNLRLAGYLVQDGERRHLHARGQHERVGGRRAAALATRCSPRWNPGSSDAIVGLFNTTTRLASAPVTISTTAAAIGLPAARGGYLVQDLWGPQSVASGAARTFPISSAGLIKATVPAEGVALYRVIPLG